MQEIKIYIVLAAMVWLWITNMNSLMLKVKGISSYPRNKFCEYLYNHKPFNCGICLSFWLGVIVMLLTNEILFLTLPLSFKLLQKTI